MNALILFSDCSRGVYIPKHFAESVDRSKISGIDLSDLDYMIECDPHGDNSDLYWETWDNVLFNCVVTDDHDNDYHLWQDGDLFLICYDLMSDEEFINFFGEERC